MKPELISVDELTRMLGIGRTKAYELLSEGKIESACIGRRRLISRKSARAYADGLFNPGEGS